MTLPVRNPLGAATLNRKYYVDVNTGSTAAPVWTPVMGITEFQPGNDPTMTDSSDFDSEGFRSSSKTADSWTLTMTVIRKVLASTPTSYDPGQEHLRAKGAAMGVANSVDVRWYEMEAGGPRAEAFRGQAAVAWSPNGGDMAANSTVAVTLTGQGRRNTIAHPAP